MAGTEARSRVQSFGFPTGACYLRGHPAADTDLAGYAVPSALRMVEFPQKVRLSARGSASLASNR